MDKVDMNAVDMRSLANNYRVNNMSKDLKALLLDIEKSAKSGNYKLVSKNTNLSKYDIETLERVFRFDVYPNYRYPDFDDIKNRGKRTIESYTIEW